jgi:hypothetical protein
MITRIGHWLECQRAAIGVRQWCALHAVLRCCVVIFRTWRRTPALTLLLCIFMSSHIAIADNIGVPRVAFFGFQLINTSLEPTSPEEAKRVLMLDDLFRSKLDASNQFQIVPMPVKFRKKLADGSEISNCNGCEIDLARELDADWIAWGTVQKVSNLILNINVYMEDARTAKMQFVKSIDIRGNTDETWRRGLDYLLRNYLFADP